MHTKKLLMLGMVMVILLMVGCGHKSPHNYYPEEKILQYSDVGSVKDVLTGDSIIHYQVIKNTEILDVIETLQTGGSTIPKGAYEKTGEDDKNIYFSDVSTKNKRATVGPGAAATGLVYFKSSQKITISIAGDYLMWSWNTGFKIKKAQLKEYNEDFMMRSLNYGGSHGNLISFEYKEGRNTQRITHNMDKGNVFKYQGAEIEIIKYTPNVLTCKVLKEFDIFK